MSEPKLANLIALNDETSSARRRELLRELTDPLFADGPSPAAPPSHPDTEVFEVSASALAGSAFLTQDDLMLVARGHDQPHLRLVAERADLSAEVVEAVIERADDANLGALLRNAAAPLSRRAAEAVVDRAAVNPDLHDAAVDRADLPAELLNELYLLVEPRLRARIRGRNADLSPAAFERALVQARRRIDARDGALPPGYAEAQAHVRALIDAAALSPDTLAALARDPERTSLLVALAELTELDFHTARRIALHRELDALAVVCRAAGVDDGLFLAFVLLIAEPAQAREQAETYARLYADLPPETASRTLRFWRMRRQTGDVATGEAAA